MTRFTLQIETDNDAFDDSHQELSRILGKVAQELRIAIRGSQCRYIFDVNGNKVGEWTIEED